MANILTLAEVRQHIPSGLSDDALTRLIDDADAEIIRRLGPAATQTEVLAGGALYLHLSRRATAITSATERVFGGVTPSETDLAADDYDLLDDGYRVERLADGTNPLSAWRGEITIGYTPVVELAQRKRLMVDLVKLSATYDGTQSSSNPSGCSVTSKDYTAEVARLFFRLQTQGRRLIT